MPYEFELLRRIHSIGAPRVPLLEHHSRVRALTIEVSGIPLLTLSELRSQYSRLIGSMGDNVAETSTLADGPGHAPAVYGSGAAPATASDQMRAGKSRWLVLVAMILAVSTPMLGILVANAALPSIQSSLGARSSEIRWIADAYLLAFAGLMLAGGSLGDRFGRKRLFMWGLVLFTISSVACGISETSIQLIASRAAQGLGAALLVPATLSNLAAGFDDKGRGAALGLWSAMSAVAVAYGPLTGAYLVQHHSWNWVFFVNVPVGLVALLLAAFTVKESREPTHSRRLDLPGIVTGSAALILLVYALAEGSSRGWRDELILGSLGLGAFFLILFLIIENHRNRPIVSSRFSGNATFPATNAVAVAVFFALFGVSAFLTAYLENVLGYSPGEMAMLLLPFAASLLVISPIAGELSYRRGSRGPMAFGCALAAGGLGLLLQTEVQPVYQSVVLPALILLASGMSLTIASMTTAAIGAVEPEKAGGASGATNTARVVGLVLGIALLGTVVSSAFRNSFLTNIVSAGVESSAARSIIDSTSAKAASLGGSFATLRQEMPQGTAAAVLDEVVPAAQGSFVEAIHSGMLLSIGFMLLAALISLIFVRSYVLIGVRTDEMAGPAKESAAAQSLDGLPTDPSPTPHAPIENQSAPAPAQVEEDVTGGADEAHETDQHGTEPPESHVQAKLTTTLFQFPFMAGTGTVLQNLTEFLRMTLPFHNEALSPGYEPAALPEVIARNLQAVTSADIATLTGYLLLEQRFGRINPEVRPELAATALVGAVRSLRLWTFSSNGEQTPDDFLEGLVTVLVEGIGLKP
jgi:EmrB/QacA subfamily drug resistance transporter